MQKCSPQTQATANNGSRVPHSAALCSTGKPCLSSQKPESPLSPLLATDVRRQRVTSQPCPRGSRLRLLTAAAKINSVLNRSRTCSLKVKLVHLDSLDIFFLYLDVNPWKKVLIPMPYSYCVRQGPESPMTSVSEQCLLSRPQSVWAKDERI